MLFLCDFIHWYHIQLKLGFYLLKLRRWCFTQFVFVVVVVVQPVLFSCCILISIFLPFSFPHMYFLFAPTLFFCFVDKLTELFKRPRKLHCICWLIIAILNIIVNKVVIYVFIQLLTEKCLETIKVLKRWFFLKPFGLVLWRWLLLKVSDSIFLCQFGWVTLTS